MEEHPAPVEVGSLSQYLQSIFFYIPGGCLGFLPSTVSFQNKDTTVEARDW